jgi:hypothetical protein
VTLTKHAGEAAQGGRAMTGPRNRKAFARSQALRAAIRSILEQHPPLLPPLTARQIARRLTRAPSERCIQWHMSAIRLEAELACVPRNSSVVSDTVASTAMSATKLAEVS